MAKKEDKTNAMRFLERNGITYTAHIHEETVDPMDDRFYGLHLAQILGQDPACVFKTLVARGASGGHFVFVIPVAATLDLKRAAKAVGEKSVSLLPVKELLSVTGYVRGGCPPIGMKKQFPTVFHNTVEIFAAVFVSGGRIGTQVELDPRQLLAVLGGKTAEIIAE